MSGSVRVLALLVATSLSAFVAACGGDNGSTDPADAAAISISLSTTSVDVAAGASGQVMVNVTRAGGFAGAVNVMADVPSGVTVDPVTIAAGSTSATLTFQVAGATAPGTLAATVRASGQGVEQVTRSLSIVVAAAPLVGFTLSLDPASVEIQQGAGASVAVNISRTGGFSGDVALTASGLPAGVTAAFAPRATTANSSTMTLTASGGASTGAATVTVVGEADGAPDGVANLGVTVNASTGGGSGNAVWSFCELTGIPIWFAFQDGDGPWTRATADAENIFRFRIDSDEGAIAFVTPVGDGHRTEVYHYGRAELLTVGQARCASEGPKTINGSVADLGDLEVATISLGGSFASLDWLSNTSNFTLNNVEDAPLTLVAARTQFSPDDGSYTPDRYIIRRNLDPADGSTLPPLDFTTEGFAPVTANITINGLGAGELTAASGNFLTGRSNLPTLYGTPFLAEAVRPYWGVPASELETGDVHAMQVFAYEFSEDGVLPPVARGKDFAFVEVVDRAVTLGPHLATPTVSAVGGGPNARLRANWTLQPEYESFVYFSLTQSGIDVEARTVIVGASRESMAGATAAEMVVPDLSGAAGWNTDWGLVGGVSTIWIVTGTGAPGPWFLPVPQDLDGLEYFTASRSGMITP